MNACQVQGWPLTLPIAHRLFEELWVPLVNDTFAKGATVYMHLIGPMGKRLLHAAQMQPGLEQAPTTNAGKLKLVDTLVTLIDSNQHHAYVMPGPAAKPETSASEDPVAAAADRPPTPQANDAPPASAMLPRKLVFDGASIDKAGIQLLMRVYLDGCDNLPPFIKYFPVLPPSITLPNQFRPEEARHPGWKVEKLKEQWAKRRYVAFEVCRQAPALQQAVNARVPVVEAHRQEEHRQSKKKFVPRVVSIDLRTAASKVVALLQAAMQANKKNGCHPQSIETLSTMFQQLRAGKQDDVSVHRSTGKNMPPSSMPASSLQRWMCIASSSDVEAMVAELYV